MEPHSTPSAASRMLRDRASSYVRDANTFAASPGIEDNAHWATTYRAIAQELAKVADEISQRRGGSAMLEPLSAHVWIVNRVHEYDGLYVFEDEHRARDFAGRYSEGDVVVTEEIVMNDSAAAQFLIDTAEDDVPM